MAVEKEVVCLKLSIVIPIYNTRDYLRACLDSVIVPELRDYEIILVNDGSTDDSGLIAAEYAGRYPERIRLITTENGGLGAARNTGLEKACGEFLFFLDSDDRLCEGALQEMMAELTPQRDMILFDFLSVRPDGSVIERLPGCEKTGLVNLASYPELLMAYPSGCNKVCRRTLFTENDIRFPGRVWYEDLRTMPKLYLCTDRIWATGKAWYCYLTRPGSITKSANLARNLEIIDAADDLTDYYRARGQFETYRSQLEYVVFYNVFLTGSMRICTADPASPLLPELREALLARFPGYAENPYVRAMPLKHRVLTALLMRGHYRSAAGLMKLKAALT